MPITWMRIPVGRGDDSDIDLDGFGSAETDERFFLNHPEQFHLHVERHLADFVQEQSSSVGGLEDAYFGAVGAGEGAFFMAEQFAFQNGRRQGAATHRHKGLGLSGTAVVNQVGDQFLARPAFAVDHYGRFGVGQPFCQGDAFLNGFAFSDDGVALHVFFFEAVKFLPQGSPAFGGLKKIRDHTGKFAKNVDVLIGKRVPGCFVAELNDADDLFFQDQGQAGDGLHLHMAFFIGFFVPALVVLHIVGNDHSAGFGDGPGDSHPRRYFDVLELPHVVA